METGDHREAAQRYARAVELLPMTAWQGADRASVETQLTEARGLASDAAAARLTADGNAEAALVLLETGRGVMWTRMLQLRAESTALQREHPELATRLAEIASRLTLLDGDGESAGLVPLSPSQRIDHRARLAREYRDLVRQAVAAGHGDFLAPPSREELLSAAAAGPVVVVNISRWRCDALVVTTAGVTACPLPGLDAARVEEWAAAHLAAQHRVDRAHAALHRARTAGVNPAAFRAQHDARNEVRQATRHAETMLERVLGLLWDTVAEPVLAHLAETGSAPSAGRAAHGASPADVGGGDRPATPEQDDAPRLWWCPTGALALLPLHAAGHYESSPDMAPAGGPRTLLDRFTCSSVPTVRALARARTVPRHHAGEPGAAGGRPDADGGHAGDSRTAAPARSGRGTGPAPDAVPRRPPHGAYAARGHPRGRAGGPAVGTTGSTSAATAPRTWTLPPRAGCCSWTACSPSRTSARDSTGASSSCCRPAGR